VTAPLLSVLIPAYNQPAGVERLLAGVCVMAGHAAPGAVEVLVSDDSTDDVAAQRIEAACTATPVQPAVRYRRQVPSLGAVPNWNHLLDQARGRYVWLLHHDEEPDAPEVLAVLLAELGQPECPDVFLLRCRVQHRPGSVPRLHFPPAWAAFMLGRWPGYLLRRNVIGPPSALWIKRSVAVHYNPALVWLVDVEAYVRLRAGAGRVQAWSRAGVLSRVQAELSITASLGRRREQIARYERLHIAQAGGASSTAAGAGFWLSDGFLTALPKALETLLWWAWRVGQRLWPWR